MADPDEVNNRPYQAHTDQHEYPHPHQHQNQHEHQQQARMNGSRHQSQNRYAHLVSGSSAQTAVTELNDSSGANLNGRQQVHTFALAGDKQKSYHATAVNLQQHQKPPPLAAAAGLNGGQGHQASQQTAHGSRAEKSYYYSSFSSVDWHEQWLIMKEKTLEKVEEPECQRKLIMLIVCTALLLDNMLYMVIVPIIPDYLRSIGAWSTYTENAKWIRKNSSYGRAQWEQVGGQVVYEGEDSAVGFLFASKAIVQLIANPFSGAIADRIGYEIPMMFGLIVMFFSTMVFACGQTYSVLFLARSLQGVGSAFADTPGIAMLADRFTEETERRRAQGIAIAFISFGCLVAPPFGSVLYQGAGKEVPFIILSLVCLLDGSLLLLVAPPGTFTQLLPSYNNNKQQQPGQQMASGLAQSNRTPDSAIKEPSNQVVAIHPTGGGSRTQPAQGAADLGVGEQQSQEKKRALYRQKSISRRHSMTVSAGEAPKGTPIEVLLKDPCIACCAGALVVANISLAFLEPTISIWVKSTMPDTEEWQEGMIWLPAFFPHVLGVFSTLRLAEKYPKSTWIIASSGLVIEGLGCLVVPFCSSFWSLIIPISVICFGVALIDTAILPTLGFLVDTRFTSVYGNVYAIADISYSVSYAIGPIIAGGIVEAIGFTALNFLIAIVTLGYTPVLMMLRTIRDYEPFELDQTGLAAERAKPFGQFGRPPIEEEDEEGDEEAGRGQEQSDGQTRPRPIGYQPSQAQPATTKYEPPAWAGGSSFKKSGKQTKSVTIVEDSIMQQQQVASSQDSYSPDTNNSRNPFLAR